MHKLISCGHKIVFGRMAGVKGRFSQTKAILDSTKVYCGKLWFPTVVTEIKGKEGALYVLMFSTN